MIYLQLFLTFLKIGAVSFGGGYGMIPLISEAVVNNGWMNESDFVSFIAVAESTPGPIAVNMATFIGSAQGGFLGSLLATFGVILPAFLIILLVVALFRNLLNHRPVQAVLSGVRPCVVALILATAVTMGLRTLFGLQTIHSGWAFHGRELLILAVLVGVGFGVKRWRGKKPSPVLLILLSAVMGIALYA